MPELEELSREELIALALRQAGVIVELQAANVALEQRVGVLERQLSRNSRNSSMPPSSDDLPGRSKPDKPQRVKGSGRQRGKQAGAAGSALSWVANPDERVPHRPAGRCGCGQDLASAADVGIERSHQVHDLPEVRIKVWQHDVYRVRCGCGGEHVGALPGQVSTAPISYGVNIKTLVAYLLVYQHVPVARCAQLITDLTGGNKGPSTGFVHGMLARCATVVRPVVEVIKDLIRRAGVAGFDETTLRAGGAGQKKYVLSASTELATVYHLGGRDLDSFTAAGILPDFAGIAVHDRYANYFHTRWEHLAGHQACTSHLIRDFTDAAQSYPDEHWPAQAQRALQRLIRAWHTARDAGQAEIAPGVRDPLVREFRHAILVGLAHVPRVPGPKHNTAQHPGRDLLEFCHDREADTLRFCHDTRVWPTNNISERDLRPTKTQQKISGRLTSEDITQDRLDIRSYIDTARKHGISVITALRQAITGTPWTPPQPEPT